MPAENRQQDAATLAVMTPAGFNAFQDKMEILLPFSEDEGAMPPSFRGGIWLYGEWTLAPGVTWNIDNSIDYWSTANDPYDWRWRLAHLFVVKVAAANELPSGNNHAAATIGVGDIAWKDCSFHDTAKRWKPYAGQDLYIYCDDAGGIYAQNTSVGSTYYFYLMGMFTRSIQDLRYGPHRIKSFADYARMSAAYYNGHQDRTVMLWAATKEEDGLPGTFLGATKLYGQFTILAGADKLLDDTRDWRGRIALMHWSLVPAANRLPAGVNHDPSVDPTTKDYMLWCTKTGVAVGGPFPAGSFSWNPAASGLRIYADNANGYLYASNTTGAAIYFYLTAKMTGTI